MKKILLLIATCLPLLAHSSWIDKNGKAIPETESMRSDREFGAQIVLTSDEKGFRETWYSSKTPPTLNATKSVRKGESVSAMIIFSGCTPNRSGVCEVMGEFSVIEPDGSPHPAGETRLWSAGPQRAGLLLLGDSSVSVGFGPTDQQGKYKIAAIVKDKVSGRTVSIATGFDLSK